jgi:hypothetical protein
MQGEKKERWERLCEQASTEQDPVKMLKLITEINELLMAKETRLLKAHPPASTENPRKLPSYGPKFLTGGL